MDLWDQPKPPYASWGWDGPNTRDWHVAAQNTGNSILAKNPQWLIFVAGLGTNGWMGSDLGYVTYSPVKLSLPNQLVYETHEWSQEVYKQEYFSDPAYPRNLRGVWKSRWGYLQQNSISPVFIGAFGTNFDYPVPDHQWLGKFVSYMNGAFTTDNRSDLALGQKGMSWAVGSSGIGILEDDFQTVRANLWSYINTSVAPVLSGPLPSSQPSTFVPSFKPSKNPSAKPRTFGPSIRPTSALSTTNYPTVGSLVGQQVHSYFSVRGSQLVDGSGNTVRIAAVNW